MLDKKDLSLYTQIGSGVEGIVYDIGNNNVAKIFNKIDLDKMEKIYELKNAFIENLNHGVAYGKQKVLGVEYKDGTTRYIDLEAQLDITDVDYLKVVKK